MVGGGNCSVVDSAPTSTIAAANSRVGKKEQQYNANDDASVDDSRQHPLKTKAIVPEIQQEEQNKQEECDKKQEVVEDVSSFLSSSPSLPSGRSTTSTTTTPRKNVFHHYCSLLHVDNGDDDVNDSDDQD